MLKFARHHISGTTCISFPYFNEDYRQCRNTALQIIAQSQTDDINPKVYMHLVDAYSAMDMNDSARYYIAKIKDVPQSLISKVNYFSSLKRYSANVENYKESYNYQNEVAAITDSIDAESIYSQLQNVEYEHQKFISDQEHIIRMASDKKVFYYIILIGVVLVVITGYFFIKYSKRASLHKQIVEELKNSQDLMISSLDRDISSLLKSRIEIHRQLNEVVGNFGTSPKKLKEKLNVILNSGAVDSEEFLLSLRNFVNLTTHRGIDLLISLYPTLTESDVNFICMEYINLSIIEIQYYQKHKSINSTYNQRALIKKKLNLSVPIKEYMENLFNQGKKQQF